MIQKASSIPSGQIAGEIEPCLIILRIGLESLTSEIRPIPISRRQVFASDHQFSNFSRSYRRSAVVEHHEFDIVCGISNGHQVPFEGTRVVNEKLCNVSSFSA